MLFVRMCIACFVFRFRLLFSKSGTSRVASHNYQVIQCRVSVCDVYPLAFQNLFVDIIV